MPPDPQPDHDRHLVPGQGQRDQRLAIRALAKLAAILARHACRQRAFLGQSGVINHQKRVPAAQQAVRLLGQRIPQRSIVPGRAGDEMLQLIVPGQAQSFSHRL